MEEREYGFYWVEECDDETWTVGKYIGDELWFLPADSRTIHNSQLRRINETRILTPDEQAEEDFHAKADNDR